MWASSLLSLFNSFLCPFVCGSLCLANAQVRIPFSPDSFSQELASYPLSPKPGVRLNFPPPSRTCLCHPYGWEWPAPSPSFTPILASSAFSPACLLPVLFPCSKAMLVMSTLRQCLPGLGPASECVLNGHRMVWPIDSVLCLACSVSHLY